MQVEDLINHEKKAKEFLSAHQETKRTFQAKIRDGNTNFIHENKHDARVWQDLDQHIKQENSNTLRMRQLGAKEKHETIVKQKHEEAIHYLSKQETNRKIKNHILGVIQQR